MNITPWLVSTVLLGTLSPALGQSTGGALTSETINAASLDSLMGMAGGQEDQTAADKDPAEAEQPDAAVVRLQILLDRAGASPGVIDGFDGENVRKAVAALEIINGLQADGELDAEVIKILETSDPVLFEYEIAQEDVESVVDALPEDYAELSKRDHLGFTSLEEALAEKFHMDIDLFKTLNAHSALAFGEKVIVAELADPLEGAVARIEADKKLGQLRGYDNDDKLLVAYPATVGSDANPSPAGTHTITAIAPEPTYTYNPDLNFQQGDNDEVLELAAGPNNPVGSVWIDLSEPTYGIHGTPEPSEVDKTGSHGCVRLTNWDAEELAGMVEKGVTVEFIQ